MTTENGAFGGDSVNVELKDVNGNGNFADSAEKDDPTANSENLDGFLPLLVAAQVIGLLGIALLFYACLVYSGGFGFTDIAEFNWHPLFMSIGMVYLMGNGLLAFRIFRNLPKPTIKLIHASSKGVVALLTILASIAVFDFHYKGNKPDLYSMHSWVGLITIILFFSQGILGFSAYLYPGFKPAYRSLLMQYHVFFGQAIFALGIVSVISGINEKAIFALGSKYSELGALAVLLNLSGVLFVVFAVIVVYLATNFNYKRYPRSEDNVVLN